jgi:2-oxoglutarate ferredoxin oxidoreductase subunit alpha
LCHEEKVDLVVAFDKASLEHLSEIREGGVFVYDEKVIGAEDIKAVREGSVIAGGVSLFPVPLKAIAEGIGGAIFENTVALGIISGIVGLDGGFVKEILREKFADKGEAIVEKNLKAFDEGVGIIGGRKFGISLEHEAGGSGGADRLLLNGNDAICLGAVKSGCKFVAEYPMTPSSSILHTMAGWADKFGIVVKHAEDEIAAMNMIVGAGFAGARALTATSGGGFALMTEAVSLAGCSETPCVVVEAQRPGPSTGLPTRTEQGDLRQVLHAGQGDYPRLVMAPGDIDECFEMGFSAFNYADRFQIPVLILIDKYLSETFVSTEDFENAERKMLMKIERGKIVEKVNGDFKRYVDSMDGISERTLPGTPFGEHVTTSYEHDEGSLLVEDVDSRNLQMRKRMRKMETLGGELPEPVVIDGEGKEIEVDELGVLFVGFGSLKPVLMEACGKLAEGGGKKKAVKSGILMLKYLAPFQSESVKKILNKAIRAGVRVIGVEQNFSGQLCGLVREKTGIEIEERILKYDGREMDGEWVMGALRERS